MSEYATESQPDPFAQDCPPPTTTAYPDDGTIYGPRVQYDDGTEIVDAPPAAAPSPADLDAAHGHYAEPEGERTEYIGPHAYQKISPDGKIEYGAGLVHSETPDAKVDILSVQNHTNTDMSKGADINAQVVKFDVPVNDHYMGMDGGLLDASVQNTYSDDESACGIGANLADGAVTVGTNQNNARFGVSMGVGMGGRIHHSKDPNTYKRSYGIGFDAGPFSGDFRTDAFSDPELNDTAEGRMVNPEDLEAEEAPGARFNVPITGYAEPAK